MKLKKNIHINNILYDLDVDSNMNENVRNRIINVDEYK